MNQTPKISVGYRELSLFLPDTNYKVSVKGKLVLEINIGGATAKATHAENLSTTADSILSFRYTVRNGDTDRDGISIAKDALKLANGTIRGQQGRAALLELGSYAILNDDDHIVVTDATNAERQILKEALAAHARAHLSSATGVIGARFSDLSSVKSDSVHSSTRSRTRERIPSHDFNRRRGNSERYSLNRATRRAYSVKNARSSVPRNSSGVFQVLQSPRSYSISLGRKSSEESPPTNWTLWTTRDSQDYESSSTTRMYDGDLDAQYMGIDGQIGENWFVGTALSRNWGETQYSLALDDSGVGGLLSTESTMLHPYLQRSFSNGVNVWVIGGLGEGEAEIGYEGNWNSDRSGLQVHLGALGVTKEFLTIDSAKLALVADTGFASIRTDSSKNDALKNLSTTVTQMRFGLQGAHDWKLFGRPLIPTWRVSCRYDGDSGIRGFGTEVSLSAIYKTDRARLMVKGRWLVTNHPHSVREFGSTASLEIKPQEDRSGWAASISSRLEGASEPLSSLRDEIGVYARSGLISVLQSQQKENITYVSHQGRISYGLALRNTSAILKPFGEFRRIGNTSQLRSLGFEFYQSAGKRPMEMQFSIGQLSENQRSSKYQMGFSIEFGL